MLRINRTASSSNPLGRNYLDNRCWNKDLDVGTCQEQLSQEMLVITWEMEDTRQSSLAEAHPYLASTALHCLVAPGREWVALEWKEKQRFSFFTWNIEKNRKPSTIALVKPWKAWELARCIISVCYIQHFIKLLLPIFIWFLLYFPQRNTSFYQMSC